MLGFCEYLCDMHLQRAAVLTMAVSWPFVMKAFINASYGLTGKQGRTAPKSHTMARKASIDDEAWSQRVPA